MVPISAAIEAPTRPATIRPASTGPSSRVTDRTTMVGIALDGLEAGEAGVALQRQHHAGEDRGQADHRQRIEADVEHLAHDLARVKRTAHATGDRLGRE